MDSSCRVVASTLVFLFLFVSFSEAKDYLVGGKTEAWKIPTSESDSLNKWAENSRFLIGDSLVWKYDSDKDSVLQVTKEDYVKCNTSSPIKGYKDGNTRVELRQSGPYYFISGAEGHCEKGQKLVVVVMSAKHRTLSIGVSPAPSPSEFQGQGPAVAPTSSASGLRSSLMMVALWVLMMFLSFA